MRRAALASLAFALSFALGLPQVAAASAVSPSRALSSMSAEPEKVSFKRLRASKGKGSRGRARLFDGESRSRRGPRLFDPKQADRGERQHGRPHRHDRHRHGRGILPEWDRFYGHERLPAILIPPATTFSAVVHARNPVRLRTDEWGWLARCEDSYDSFDPHTGAFGGADGKLHRCR